MIYFFLAWTAFLMCLTISQVFVLSERRMGFTWNTCMEDNNNIDALTNKRLNMISKKNKNFTFGNAYIITTKNDIPLAAKEAAIKCGFRPILFPAVQPISSVFRDLDSMYQSCLPEVLSLNSTSKRKKMIDFLSYAKRALTLGELALICSHRRAMQVIAEDESRKDSDFSLILEDDAKLHPRIADAVCLLNRAISLSTQQNGYGFIYLGLKVSRGAYLGCRSKASALSDQWIVSDCNGHGTHAYAITKQRAKTFLSEVYRQGNILPEGSLLQIDQVFNRHFKSLYGRKCYSNSSAALRAPSNSSIAHRWCTPNYGIGYNLISPESPRSGPIHKGIIYQFNMSRASRGAAGTSLKSKNRFLDVSCYSFQSSRVHLPHLLFLYAAAAGICTKKWFDLKTCVSLKIHAENGEEYLNEFQFAFKSGLPMTPCNSTGTVFQEHPSTKLAIRYDDSIRATRTGSYLYGNFRSFKYFHPHMKDKLQELLQFRDDIDEAAYSLWEAIPDRISKVLSERAPIQDFGAKSFELLCVSVDREDSVLKQPSWAQSADYFRSSILKMYERSKVARSSSKRKNNSNSNSSDVDDPLRERNYYVLIFVGDGEAVTSGRPISSSWNYSELSTPSRKQRSVDGERDKNRGEGRYSSERRWVNQEIINHPSLQSKDKLFIVQDSDIDFDNTLQKDPAVRLKVFSQCQRFVISTDAFGWWGAYLAELNSIRDWQALVGEVMGDESHEAVRVLVPFVGAQRSQISADDYYMKSWVQMKRDTQLRDDSLLT